MILGHEWGGEVSAILIKKEKWDESKVNQSPKKRIQLGYAVVK